MQFRLSLRELSPSSPTPHSVFPSSNWNYRNLGRREKEKISSFLFYFLVYCSFFLLFMKALQFMEKLVMTTKQTKRVSSCWPPKENVNNLLYIFPEFYFSSVETIFFSKMNKCYTKFSNGRHLEKVRFYKYVICIFSRQKLRTKTSVIPPCVFSVGGWAFFLILHFVWDFC